MQYLEREAFKMDFENEVLEQAAPAEIKAPENVFLGLTNNPKQNK